LFGGAFLLYTVIDIEIFAFVILKLLGFKGEVSFFKVRKGGQDIFEAE
jgi:hypothetical protein